MALHVMDEANRCLQCKVPQCRKGCPINTNIPEAIRLLKENKLAIMNSSAKDTVFWEEKALRCIFPQ